MPNEAARPVGAGVVAGGRGSGGTGVAIIDTLPIELNAILGAR